MNMHRINPEAIDLLRRYQQVCAEGVSNYHKCVEFEQQSWWQQWLHRKVLEELVNEGKRLLARKEYLADQLAHIPITL